MQSQLLYIANIRLPTEKAHGIQIMKTCESLARQGIEVELIVPRRLNRIKQDPFEFYGVEKNFKITKLWCLDLISWNIFGTLGFWIESWTFYRAVKQYFRGQNKAVYYTRDLPLACWLSKKVGPFYYEIHTLPDKILSIHKETWGRCKGLVVISDRLKDELIKQSISENKILVARDAVDLKEFTRSESKEECRKKLGLPLDKKIVVYTGHLYKWKGADLLARAASFVPPHVQVYLVGGTEEDIQKFKKIYKTANLHIVGWQPREIIPCWLTAADLLVLPNSAKEAISSLYTSPLKLFEYMAIRTPMLLAKLSSIQEVMGDHGKYFEPDNEKSLAEGIIQGLIGSSEQEQMNEWTQEEIKKYTWEERAERIKSFVFSVK